MPEDDVTFMLMGPSTFLAVVVSQEDASEIHGRCLEKSLAADGLDHKLKRATTPDSGEREVVVDEEPLRLELVRILEAIKADHPLTASQEELRQVVERPAQHMNFPGMGSEEPITKSGFLYVGRYCIHWSACSCA